MKEERLYRLTVSESQVLLLKAALKREEDTCESIIAECDPEDAVEANGDLPIIRSLLVSLDEDIEVVENEKI